jgi:o-succinylbenzoate---CoA ligase
VNELVVLDLPGRTAFVDALERIWDAGDAAFPIDRRLPASARAEVIAAMEPSAIVDEHGRLPVSGGRPVEPGDALVVATSGSMGAPKGVVLTHDAIAASARATSKRIGVQADDHWLSCLPLSHVGGLSVITRALTLGTGLTVQPGFNLAAVVDAATTGGATLVSLVPTALQRIDPALFRMIVLGGSRPPADRPANVVATYGMTETGSGVVYDGQPLDGVEILIADDGEIHLRCPMLLRCYRDGHDPRDADGWFPTGDLGGWLPDGRLYVEGRRGSLIITGGEKVWPEAVEAVLLEHPLVADCAIVGRADPEWGQRVTAIVVPNGPAAPIDLDSLRDHVKESLPAYCAPRALELVAEIPRTSLGKIRRSEL